MFRFIWALWSLLFGRRPATDADTPTTEITYSVCPHCGVSALYEARCLSCGKAHW